MEAFSLSFDSQIPAAIYSKVCIVFACMFALSNPADESRESEMVPICTGEEGEPACWILIETMPNCHVWNRVPRPSETVTFDGSAECQGGRLTGDGTLTWSWTDDGESVTRKGDGPGPYVDGRRDGIWVISLGDDWQSKGEYVAGKEVGRWDTFDADGRIVGGGEYVHGSPNGYWEIATWDGFRAKGEYVDGKIEGKWVFPHADGYVTTGEYMSGEPTGRWLLVDAREEIIEEKNYTVGKLQGKYFYMHKDPDYQVTGSFANGLRDGTWVAIPKDRESGSVEVTYVDGMKHGAEVLISEDGFRRIGNFENGQRTGQWSLFDQSDNVLFEASFSQDEVQDFILNSASLPSSTAPTVGRAPIDGAFGLLFGPAGFNQITQLTCGNRSCLDEMAVTMLWAYPSRTERYNYDGSRWFLSEYYSGYFELRPGGHIVSDIHPPRPVAGGSDYTAKLTWDAGVTGISAKIGSFQSEDSCEVEALRLRELLRGKYGECTDYRYNNGTYGRAPIGQCDSRGLPERGITAFCSVDRNYDEDETTKEHHYVALSYQMLLEHERAAVMKAWMERGQVGAEDL